MPANRNADITRVIVQHCGDHVTLTIHVGDLRRRTTHALVELVTPGDDFWVKYLYTRRGEELSLMSSSDPDSDTCVGQAAQFRPGRDVMVLVAPRSCLGDPAWVRTNVEVETWPARQRGNETHEDLLLGPVAAVTTPRLSPRIPYA